jgi:putative heme iron utilization protein
MPENPRPATSLFTHIDVTTTSTTGASGGDGGPVGTLLSQMLAAQNRQNELMEQLIQQLNAAQRQRSAELGQWKQANPRLAKRCRQAAETLGQIQTQFLENVTDEIATNGDCMMDGDFMLNEFVDRFGPRLAHLNGVLQVLSQLSSVATSE